MSQLRRILPFVLLVVLIPASASAQGFFRWLGRLSGPGPFWGAGAELGVKCFGVEKPPAKPAGEIEIQTINLRFIVDDDCRKASVDDRFTTIYINFSGSIAENNPLFYGDAGHQTESTAVRMLKIGASADWTVHKTLDIGTGFGLLYFAGPRFDNFSRGYVQPLRFSLRPLMFWSTKKDDGWLLLQANWQIIVGTIDGADFGAPLDPFESKNEQDVEIGVAIDVFRLFKKFSKP